MAEGPTGGGLWGGGELGVTWAAVTLLFSVRPCVRASDLGSESGGVG